LRWLWVALPGGSMLGRIRESLVGEG
jgi:hypothetical protein